MVEFLNGKEKFLSQRTSFAYLNKPQKVLRYTQESNYES